VIFDATLDHRAIRVEVKPLDGGYRVSVDGHELPIDVEETGPATLHLLVDGCSFDVALARHPDGYQVELPEGSWRVELVAATRGGTRAARKASSGPTRVTAPMPGRLARVLVTPGQEIEAGAGLVVVEAMKMENELSAPRAGRVKEVPVAEGQAVEAGALLAVLE
jgi:biotin carboxyl carrier protein